MTTVFDRPSLVEVLLARSPWRVGRKTRRGRAHAVLEGDDRSACGRTMSEVYDNAPFSPALIIFAGAQVCERCAREIRR